MSEVFTLLATVGRIEGDGLPEGAMGAALLLFAPSKDAESAVRETVQLLRDAGLNPLEITNYGTAKEREAEGYEFSDAEQELIDEAAREGATIILEKTVLYDEDDSGARH